VEIIVSTDESVDRALKRFKRLCERSGILADVRNRRHYEKPSERRKRKLATAIRKRRRTRVS
jgi:small subunit ribosomal protein S21